MLTQTALQSVVGAPARDIAAEANHRIANSLTVVGSLVRRHISQISKSRRTLDVAEVCSVLEEVTVRVDSVARLHRLLAGLPPGESIELGTYLREIVEELCASFSDGNGMRIEYELEEVPPLAPERALCAGLIVGELVTNALKYAHPTGIAGFVRVTCRPGNDESIVIEVSDDGIGLPENLDLSNGDHLGLSLVRSLALPLGGGLSFRNEGLGLACLLEIPAQALRA